MRMERLEKRMLLAIYAPDVSFGQGGHAAVLASSLLTQLPDGSILAAGVTTLPSEDDFGGYESKAFRINPDGTIDKTLLDFFDYYKFTWTGSKLLVTGPGEGQTDQLFI